MTDGSDNPEDLSPRQQQVYDLIEAHAPTTPELEDALDISHSTVGTHINRIQDKGHTIEQHPGTGEWYTPDGEDPSKPAPGDEDVREDLTPREEHIYRSLPESETHLANELEISTQAVRAHIDAIEAKGWTVEDDGEGNYLGPDQDHLRSSEHKTTRTRKANKWWQRRHDELVHEFQELDWPTADPEATPGNEDWVLHLTDLHVGDKVRRDDGRVVYDTDRAVDIVEYITAQSLDLAATHGREYDTAYILWGGDMVTNEGIYEGQFEDLDAWLDEQLEAAVDALLAQVAAHAQHFDAVRVIGQIGNHGDIRASGVSRQANADLILYKWIRNVIANVQEWATEHPFENVGLQVGEARNFRNFTLRDGKVRGHLRHGQDAKPQATTAAGKRDWRGWLLDHDFDISWMGHYHISGRLPWDGPPVIASGSPKPAGDFVESLGGRPSRRRRQIATAHGVSDEGITGIFPIDTRGRE